MHDVGMSLLSFDLHKRFNSGPDFTFPQKLQDFDLNQDTSQWISSKLRNGQQHFSDIAQVLRRVPCLGHVARQLGCTQVTTFSGLKAGTKGSISRFDCLISTCSFSPPAYAYGFM